MASQATVAVTFNRLVENMTFQPEDNKVTFLATGLANNWAKRRSDTAGVLFAGAAGASWVCVDTRPCFPHPRTHAPLLYNMHYIVALRPATCGGSSYFLFVQERPMHVVARWATKSQATAAESFLHEVTPELVFPEKGKLCQTVHAGQDQDAGHDPSKLLADYLDLYMETPAADPCTAEANQMHKASIMAHKDPAYKWAACEAMVALEAGPAASDPNTLTTL